MKEKRVKEAINTSLTNSELHVHEIIQLDLFDLLKNVRNKIRLAMYVVTNITLLGAWSMALGLWLPFEYFYYYYYYYYYYHPYKGCLSKIPIAT